MVDENQISDDKNYVSDFLLTYRTFLSDPTIVTSKLLEKFQQGNCCEHIARVVLTWVNNHFNDFEMNAQLYEFLTIFDEQLMNHEDEVSILLSFDTNTTFNIDSFLYF